jgi:TolB-like protein
MGPTNKIKVKLLGGFSAALPSGVPVKLAGKKNRALLAYLAMGQGKRHDRQKLIGLLWSDRGEAQARGSLRQALSALKEALAAAASAALVLGGDSVTLDPGAVATDVAEFEVLAGSASTEDLRRAAGLYEGDLLEGLTLGNPSFEDWLLWERARLRDVAIGALARLTAEIKGPEAIALGKRLVALDPLREASHRALMQAYAAAGEKALALQHYGQCCEMLKAELGVGPARETEELRQRLLQEGEPATAAAHEWPPANAVEPKAISIAVLPFTNMSRDAGQEYFTDGLTEDLITELSKYRHLSVLSRHAVFAYKDRQKGLHEVARELTADFIVEGSVRQSGTRLRITVQLIDAPSGAHVWAERFDREFSDIFTLQDEVVAAIVAQLAFSLDEAAGEQRRRNPTTSVSAFSHFLQARAAWRIGAENAARDHLLEAVNIDPNYAQALAYLSFCYCYSLFTFTSDLALEETAVRAREYAQRAFAADQNDPFVQDRLALSYMMLGELALAKQLIDMATLRRPGDVEIMVHRGCILTHCGQHREGVAAMERAFQLEPRLPFTSSHALSDGRYMAHDYEGALSTLELIVNPPYYVSFAKVASLAQLGRIEEAKRIVAAAPLKFNVEHYARCNSTMCALPADAAHWLEGFRKAGINV